VAMHRTFFVRTESMEGRKKVVEEGKDGIK
jgi:hypothetical protein